MMGYQQGIQSKLFYNKLNLDQRIRKDHILRKIAGLRTAGRPQGYLFFRI